MDLEEREASQVWSPFAQETGSKRGLEGKKVQEEHKPLHGCDPAVTQTPGPGVGPPVPGTPLRLFRTLVRTDSFGQNFLLFCSLPSGPADAFRLVWWPGLVGGAAGVPGCSASVLQDEEAPEGRYISLCRAGTRLDGVGGKWLLCVFDHNLNKPLQLGLSNRMGSLVHCGAESLFVGRSPLALVYYVAN